MFENSELVYEDLKAKAKEKGLTLSDVCRKSGIKFVTISKWKNQNPKTLDTVKKLYETIQNHSND